MATWDEVEHRLRDELERLVEDDFLILGEPAAEAGPRRGLLRRRSAPPPTRYVQFRRTSGGFYCECVGATLFGGDWELSDAQHAQLRALGWLAPGDPDPTGTQPSYPNYWQWTEQASAATALGVGALQVLGMEPHAGEWRREG